MKKVFGLISIFVIVFLPSCKVLYPSLMFQQKGYQYFEMARKQIDQYVIEPGDEVSFRVFARDGFRLVDVLGGGAGSGPSSASQPTTSNISQGTNIAYLVDNEGFVKLPILGDLFVKGYTEKELQRVLADKYAGLFVDPFVIANVTNRRAFVFKGSSASIVYLNQGPTNLLEVIARAGGLDPTSKAYKIKVLRGDLKNPEVMLIDLSTLEGLRKADLIVQSNDIIYIEQKRQSPAGVILGELGPYLGLATTIVTVVLLAKTFSGK